jgi:peptidoglycan DL-endopeptidase CwlO
VLLSVGAGIAVTEPASIEAKRQEIAQLRWQLDGMDAQVEQASEAYNGARYELGQVDERIAENARESAQATRDLAAARKALGERLRAIYAAPDQSVIEIMLSSGSVAAASDQLELLDRLRAQDDQVVGGIKAHKARLAELKAELQKDRRTAEHAVETRREQKARVESLLARRQAVLDGAGQELRGMLKAEEDRKQREAAAQAALALRQQTAAAPSSSGSSAAPASSGSSGSSGSAPAGDTSPPPAASDANAAAASYALQFLGVPYVWGGASPSGFDCSGLASYVYAAYGKSVPHYTGAIWSAFPQVSRDQLQRGDLVFFHGLNHMGIYLGGDQFVHAPHTGDVVKVSSLSGYSGYVGAVRP